MIQNNDLFLSRGIKMDVIENDWESLSKVVSN